jgi:PilZ domain
MTERRRFPRSRVFKGAKLIVPGQARVACIVRDISAQGAGLQLPGSVDLPDVFDLCFDTGQRIRGCRKVWRTSMLAGVWFEPQLQSMTAQTGRSRVPLRSVGAY